VILGEAVAAQLNLLAGKRVVVYYKEHRGIPATCQGENQSICESSVREIDDIGVRANPVKPLLQMPQ
jgi:hypothetical protein